MTTLSLFQQAEDTPLFSGTPMRAHIPEAKPEPAGQQATLAQCPLCLDTGIVKVGLVTRRCWCKPHLASISGQ